MVNNHIEMIGQSHIMNQNSNQMGMSNSNMNQSIQSQIGFMGQNQMNPSKKN